MPSWLVFALVSALFAALTAIFAKAGLKDVDADVATAIRTVIILFITWGIVLFKGSNEGIHQLSRNNWLFLTLSGIATGVSWLFYYRALQYGKVAEVSAIDKGSLVFVLVLSFIFLKEPLTPRLMLGIGLVITGMLVIVFK
jgi:transporter family protein